MPINRTLAAVMGCAVLALAAAPALAHTGDAAGGLGGGFLSGFTHPIFGWDHVVAMIAVGLWGAFLGKPAIWLLPIVFPVVMAIGGALGIAGVPIPAVEAGIAASSIVLGLLIALAARAPMWVAAIIVGIFAIFHGHAHGAELPEAAHPVAYSIGFVIATGLLHLCGIALGLMVGRPGGALAIRTGGAAIALVGCGFLFGYL